MGLPALRTVNKPKLNKLAPHGLVSSQRVSQLMFTVHYLKNFLDK